MSRIDVLIITALKEEHDAARDVARASVKSGFGVTTWEERDVETATPYLFGTYVTSTNRFNLALARPTRMGATATSPVVATLVERLKPHCLAMCGVCAGNPSDVALGDVIIAELVYAYDEGKQNQDEFDGDHRQFPMMDAWLRAAQDMVPDGLPSFGPATIEESKNWVLDRLYAEDDPTKHAAWGRYFPQGTWGERIRVLENDGLVRRDDATLVLTDRGRASVVERRFYDPDGLQKLPFSIKVGPIASGNVVVKDGVTWERLKRWGLRSVLGLEMEGAMIGTLAHKLSVPTWIVAKGVMDHADTRKSDRHKEFAARASAEVLFKFLARQFGEKNGIDIRSAQGPTSELCVDQLEVRERIPQDDNVTDLNPHVLRFWDSENDKPTHDKIVALRRRFLERREGLFINKTFVPVATDNPILDDDNCPIAKRALIVGNAGVGKSSILAFYVKQLQNADIPVIPFSFDELPEGILTPEQLGRELGLPMSPVALLANMAKGKTSVLVVDQLDAISLTSGKRTDLWNLFEMLCDEIGTGEDSVGTPGVHLLVGCREFDLENDHRLRKLKQSESKFTIAHVSQLSREQVEGALRNAGIDLAAIPIATRDLLHLPIHLSMFIGLSLECRPGAVTRDGLFDAFWQDKEKRVQQHIGYRPKWTQAIDALCGWCSRYQELSAPDYVLDEFSADARAMVSEHVLLHAQKRYRFFHDSFFDYAFARRFAARGDRLLDVLLRGEQHLFRRAQVRTVFAFLRQRDGNAYLAELESLLLSSIRFHLKRSVLVDLYNLADPTIAEWRILLKLAAKEPDLRHHAVAAATTTNAWFDIADRAHFFDEGFASGNEECVVEIINLLRAPIILQTRSRRVAAILKRHRKPGERWSAYLASICRMGELHHDRDIFEIFLGLIDDGTLDSLRSTGERDSLGLLWKVKDANPAYACEAVAHWFDHRVKMHDPSAKANIYGDWFSGTAIERYSIQEISSKAPDQFVEWMLPRVAQLINMTAEVNSGDMARDPIWTLRHYGEDGHTIAEDILSGLAKSMESLAASNPDALDLAASSYVNRPHDTIAYLLLRAWTANPQRYANRIMEYLAADSHRLRVGYRGELINLVSRKAIECSATLCTPKNRDAVESAIMLLQTEWTPQTPRFRDRTQLDLLESMGETHLTDAARARLLELRNAFPGYKPATAVSTFLLHGPPAVSDSDLESLSDEALLNAMREQLLPWHLDTHVQSQPARYATFAIEKMSDDLPARYFDAILDGISKSYSGNGRTTIELDTIVDLLRRIHRLPSKPCGRHWAWFIERCPESNWPQDIIDAVAWYAMNDSDPDPHTTGDPEGIGINSTRGSAAYAISHLLFARRDLYPSLKGAIQSLVHDQSLAVRACAVEVLVAMLNFDHDQAITWFLECVEKDHALLRTHRIFRFLEYGSYRDHKRLRPLLQSLLDDTQPDEIVEGAARVGCILGLSHLVGLTNDEAVADLDRIHRGSDVMRKAAAEIYARHAAHKTVGPRAREYLMPFFADSNEAVRIAAAHAFHQLPQLTTDAQASTLSAFLDSKPTGKALVPVLIELERSRVELPDLVCKVAEYCTDDLKKPDGERTFAAYHYLPQIVLRLYAQKTDEDIRSRCLNMIDVMERHQVWKLYEELCKAER